MASEQADKLGKVEKGTRLQVQEVGANGWTKVFFEGRDGYIKSDYLKGHPDLLQAAQGRPPDPLQVVQECPPDPLWAAQERPLSDSVCLRGRPGWLLY